MGDAQQGITTAKDTLARLSEVYGPVMGGVQLRQALGFSSAAAMRQAALRGQVGVRLFSLRNRRGKFALTHEVATWLASCMQFDAPSEASVVGTSDIDQRLGDEPIPQESADSGHG